MGLVVSVLNSIHFSIVDSNLRNRENTLTSDEKFAAFWMKCYKQKFDDGDTITCQCTDDGSAALPTVTVYANGLVDPLARSLKSTYGSPADRWYFEFDVVMASYTAYDRFYIEVVKSGVTWRSEYIQSIDLEDDLENGNMLKLEYTNKDHSSDFPTRQVDWTTDIEMSLYIESTDIESLYEMEDEVFTNIDSKELIESQVFVGFNFKTSPLPKNIIRKIALALRCYLVVINDLQYVAEGAAEVTPMGGTNFEELKQKMLASDFLGLTTNSRGFDIEKDIESEMVITRKVTINGSSKDTFEIPAGYVMHTFTCGHDSGSAGDYTFKAGYADGDDDIITDFVGVVPQTGGNVPIPVHHQYSFDAAKTVHISVTGASSKSKIWIQLIQNE
jgi:hypothetical protein